MKKRYFYENTAEYPAIMAGMRGQGVRSQRAVARLSF